MTRIFVFLTAVTAFPAFAFGQAGTATQSAEPFKLGTFLISNAERIGIVLRDGLVVDLAQANARSYLPPVSSYRGQGRGGRGGEGAQQSGGAGRGPGN